MYHASFPTFLLSVTMSSDTPAAIGRYQVLRALGQGGMGSVYLARDPAIKRNVAVKIMRTGLEDASLRERFVREATAIGSLRHPNIVTVFDVGEHQGEPFIAMEYIEGSTLAQRLRQGDVSLLTRLDWMEGLSAGLQHAHRAGIIHRDIKPANIIIDADGGVKIVDFGIARGPTSGVTHAATRTGSVLGTLNYMSPEQLAGKAVDQRSDIYSAGVVAYELFSGRMAFPGDVQSGVLHLILVTGPEPLASIGPDLDAGLIAIVNRCLEREPERRFADMAGLRHDLGVVRRRIDAAGTPASTIVVPEDDRSHLAQARDAITTEDQTREWLKEARGALDRGALTSASLLAERVLGLSPLSAEALAIRRGVEEARRRLDDLERRARAIEALLEEGRTCLMNGQLTAASEAADSVVKLDPTNQAAAALKQNVAAVIAARSPSEAPPAASRPDLREEAPRARRPRRIGVTVVVAGVAVAIGAVAGWLIWRGPASNEPRPTASSASTSAPTTPANGPPSTGSASGARPTGTVRTPPDRPLDAASTPPAASGRQPSPTTAAPERTTAVPTPPVARRLRADQLASASVGDLGADCTLGNSAACRHLGLRYEQGHGVARDDIRALTLLQQACDGGDNDGCGDLGMMFRNGRGVKRDDTRALALFQASCDHGSSDGCDHLGGMYRDARGVAKDDVRAASLFQRACDAGSSFGCNNLGVMFDQGRGVTKDSTKALAAYQRACDAGNGLACSNLAALFDQGRGGAKDPARAATLFQRARMLDEQACSNGVSDACAYLGALFALGRGVTKDETRAEALYQQSCDGGSGIGCNNLGSLLKDGRGGPKDEAHAVGLFQEACDNGVSEGCDNLGFMLSVGRGVARDDSRAVTLFRRACDSGSWRGCNNLAVMLENGRGVVKDEPRAVSLYKTACDGGYMLACTNFGVLLETGRGTTKDESAAAALYQRACDGGDNRGCTDLGLALAAGRGLPKDDVRALALYQRACDGGDSHGCAALGLMYAAGRGVARDDAHAAALYQRACDGGYPAGCYDLGVMLRDGRVVTKDDAKAVALFQKGCDAGNSASCFGLGGMAESGRGTPKDVTRALTLYQQACKAGHQAACASAKRLSGG